MTIEPGIVLRNSVTKTAAEDTGRVLVTGSHGGLYAAGLAARAMFGGRTQSSDLSEIDYARVAEAMGGRGIRVEDPGALAGALAQGLAERGRPTLLGVVVTRDPAKMLPGVDARTLEIKPGDRPA